MSKPTAPACLLLLAWPWLTGMGIAPAPGVAATLNDYQTTLIAYFRPLGLVPISVPSGQRPGDAYGMPAGVLLARADRCFPGLAAPPPEPITLPTVADAPTATVTSALGLDSVLRYEVGGTVARTVRIAFADAATVTIGWKELKGHWAADCAELAPLFTGEPRDFGRDGTLPVVLGTVLYARPVFSLDITESARMDLEADGLTAALKEIKTRLPFAVMPEVSADSTSKNARTLTIEAEKPVPVAFAPAAFPFALTPATAAAAPLAAPLLLWRPYDPVHEAGDLILIDRVVELFTQGWVSAAP